MKTIRRIYIYAVALVSLEVVIWGMIGLVRSVFSGAALGGVEQLAKALSLVLVGAPVFTLHWAWAQNGARKQIEERYTTVRAVFLYAALLALLIPVVQNILALIGRTSLTIFGKEPWLALLGGDQSLADNLIAGAINFAAAAYFYRILQAYWQIQSQEIEGRAEFIETYPDIRRLYRYIWIFYGLAMVLGGVQQLLQYMMSLNKALGSGAEVQLANGLALLLVGLPVWVAAWNVIQNSLREPAELGSIIRLATLYILSLTGVVVVLVNAGSVTNFVLRVLLGEKMTLAGFFTNARVAFSLAVPFAGLWAYHGSILSQEVRQLPEAPRRDALRRVYNYILSLLGLLAVFLGLEKLIRFGIDLVMLEHYTWGELGRQNLASSLALLVVGLPLWLATWRPMVQEAALLTESGDHARRSVVRKGYLYLVLFASVLGVMVSAGLLFFDLLSSILGSMPPNLLLESLQLLKILLIFAWFLTYHWIGLREDTHLAEQALSERHARYPILILSQDEGEFTSAVLNALKREAPGIPVAVHNTADGAPGETTASARAIILTGALAVNIPAELAGWFAGFKGERLVLPSPTPGWYWTASSNLALPALARQAARTVRRLAEGEDLPQGNQTNSWQAVIYVMAALFALQVLFMLFALGISFVAD